jgi:hypothetical protein
MAFNISGLWNLTATVFCYILQESEIRNDMLEQNNLHIKLYVW